jgi:hypothetical protein
MLEDWTLLQYFEFLSYVATIAGIPTALWVFMHEEKKERQSEQEEIYDKLMDHYDDILARLFEHPDIDQHNKPIDDPELNRQQKILYEMLINLFERAYILLYGESELAYKRMWNSWEDYIALWVSRPNFSEMLPTLVKGEDPDFVAYIARLSNQTLTP